MSVAMTHAVFKRYPKGGSEMLLALALADHADDDGAHIFPSVKHLAAKTRQSERTVQYQLRKMEKSGWLQLVDHAHGGKGYAREYRIHPDWVNGSEISPMNAEQAALSAKGANLAPFEQRKNDPMGASIVAPFHHTQRVQSGASKGANSGTKGAIAVAAKGATTIAPQPSLTIIQPSGNHQRVHARRAASARGVRLSVDWVLPKDWGEWARQEHPDWTPEQVQRAAAQFRDHWLAKAGADACKVDWQATWRNWIRRETSFSGAARTGGFGAGPPSQAQRDAENARAKALLFGPKSEVIDV